MPYFPGENNEIRRLDEQRRITNTYTPPATLPGNLASLQQDYPWMQPGTVWGLANAGITGQDAYPIAQEELKRTIGRGQKRNSKVVAGGREFGSRKELREFRDAKWSLDDTVNTLRSYGNDEWSPATPTQQNALRSMGVFGGKKEKDRAKAIELADQLAAMGKQAEPADIVRLTRKIDRAWEEGDGGLGDFLASPLKGALEAMNLGATGIAAGNRVVGAGLEKAGIQPPEFAKDNARNLSIAAQAPLDLLNASVRDFASDIQQSPTTLGVMNDNRGASMGQNLNDMLEQTYAYQAWVEDKPTGDGWLPSYEKKIDGQESAASAAGRRARELYPNIEIQGHAWTPGRMVSNTVGWDTDTGAGKIISGLVDGTIAMKADPVSKALDYVGAANRVRKTFEVLPDAGKAFDEYAEAGLRTGTRNWVNGQQPVQWLFSDKFTDGIGTKLVDEQSPAVIWRATGKKFSTQLSHDLAKAEDMAAVRSTLAPQLGSQIENVPGWKDGIDRSRAWSSTPTSDILSLDDPDLFVKQLDDHMVNARIGLDERNRVLDKFFYAHGNGETYAAVDAAMEAFKTQLVAHGIDDAAAEAATRFNRRQFDEAIYWADRTTGEINPDFPFMQVGDDLQPVPTRHFSSQRLNSSILMPNSQDMREMTSALADLYGKDGYKAARYAAEAGMNIWKIGALFRPAWTIRVVGDEQLRMTVAGTSMFRHPFSHIAAVIGGIKPDSKWGKYVRDANGEEFFADAADPLAEGLTGRFGALSSSASGAGKRVRLPHYTIVDRVADPDAWAHGAIEEIMGMHTSPEVRRALTSTPQQLVDALWDGDLKWVRYQMAATARREVDEAGDLTLFGTARPKYEDMLGNTPQAREALSMWVDQIYKDIQDFTLGDEALREAIRTGKIDGAHLVDQFKHPTDEALSRMADLRDSGRGPNNVRAQSWASADKTKVTEGKAALDGVVRSFFSVLMTKPSDYLSRSPHLRQGYWDEVEKLAVTLDTKGRQRVLKNIEKANISGDQERRIIEKLAHPEEGSNSFKTVDTIAKGRALDKTRDLLYDLNERSQFFEATRLLFPFGEAWREVMTRWLGLAKDYPQIVRRAEQGINGARQAAIFHTDPTTGQEVVSIPGTEWLTDKLIGVKIPMSMSARGLNMVGTGAPGIGPLAAFPLGLVIPDDAKWQPIRNFLFPFGEPEGEAGDRVFRQFVPPWVQKVATAVVPPNPDDNRLYGNKFSYVMSYLASTGEYDLNGSDAHDEMRRLYNDAAKKTPLVYAVTGALQSTLPSAPIQEWQVEDKGGRQYLLQTVKDDYRKREDKFRKDGHPDPEFAATEWLLDRYGPNIVFGVEPMSESKVFGLNDAGKQNKWEKANQDLVDKYPNTWALYAPKGGEFDIGAYTADFAQDQRDAIDPETRAHKANAHLASHIYEREVLMRAQEHGGLTKTDQAQLAEYKAQLAKDFPGYQVTPDFSYASRLEEAVGELSRAAADPSVARSDAGRGLKTYMEARQSAMDVAQQKLGRRDPFSSKDTQYLRDWLTETAQKISEQHPKFFFLWDEVLSKEFADG